jgi:hypothetical protein
MSQDSCRGPNAFSQDSCRDPNASSQDIFFPVTHNYGQCFRLILTMVCICLFLLICFNEKYHSVWMVGLWIVAICFLGYLLTKHNRLYCYFFNMGLRSFPVMSDRPTHSQLEKTNRIIWSYWHTNHVPPLIHIAYLTWKYFNPSYIIVMVTPDTMKDYLSSDALPAHFSQLFVQRQSDVIRILLLEKYGGVWMDSSILHTAPLLPFWETNDFDLAGFNADFFNDKPAQNMMSQDRHQRKSSLRFDDFSHPVIENWFLVAPKNSLLIKKWKEEIFRGLAFRDDSRYIKNLTQEHKVNLQNITSPVYLMMHCALLKVLREKPYRVKYINASDSIQGPFNYLIKHNWDTPKAVHSLLTSSFTSSFPQMIKMRGTERPVFHVIWSEHVKIGKKQDSSYLNVLLETCQQNEK